MRLLVVALVLTLGVAITASVFAIWPVVADAPWEDSQADVEPTARAADNTAAFTAAEAKQLAQQQVQRLPFPSDMHLVRCDTARYIAGNDKWVVTCGFWPGRDQASFFDSPNVTRTYVLDDDTGKLVD